MRSVSIMLIILKIKNKLTLSIELFNNDLCKNYHFFGHQDIMYKKYTLNKIQIKWKNTMKIVSKY
jgi:hypothetical protein